MEASCCSELACYKNLQLHDVYGVTIYHTLILKWIAQSMLCLNNETRVLNYSQATQYFFL